MGNDSRGWAAVSFSGLVFPLICREGGIHGARRPDSHQARGPRGPWLRTPWQKAEAAYLPGGSECVCVCVTVVGEAVQGKLLPAQQPPHPCTSSTRAGVSCTGNAAALVFSPLVLNNNEVTGLWGLRAHSTPPFSPRGWPVCVYVCVSVCVRKITYAWGHTLHNFLWSLYSAKTVCDIKRQGCWICLSLSMLIRKHVRQYPHDCNLQKTGVSLRSWRNHVSLKTSACDEQRKTDLLVILFFPCAHRKTTVKNKRTVSPSV